MSERLQDDGWAVNAAAKAICKELNDDWNIGSKYWTHVAHIALAAVDKLNYINTGKNLEDARMGSFKK